METKKTIQTNEELYGDFELIPLNLDAVQQRVDFFREKVEKSLNSNDGTVTKFHKAWEFWKEIKEKHCLPKDLYDEINTYDTDKIEGYLNTCDDEEANRLYDVIAARVLKHI